MDLKRKHEIRQMKEYLPGYAAGLTPTMGALSLASFSNAKSDSSTSLPSVSSVMQGGGSGLSTGSIGGGEKSAPGVKQSEAVAGTTRGAESTFAEQGGNIVSSAIGFAGATANAFGPVKGTSELMSDAGTSYAAGNGFGYQQQNNIDANKQLDELSKENTNNTFQTMGSGAALGAAVGSIVPGLGTIAGGLVGGAAGLITGIFGGESRRKRLERKIFAANQQVQATNLFNRSSAHSDYLASTYNQKHANTQDDLLYGAKKGKDMFTLMPGYAYGYAYSADGEGFGPANARGAYKEGIWDPIEGTGNTIKTGKLDQDTNLVNVKRTDVIFGNVINPKTGRTYRDDAFPLISELERLRNNKYE